MNKYDEKNITFISYNNKCPFDETDLLIEERELHNQSFNNDKWEKEILQICPKCGSYCIDKNVSHTFKLKYNQYTFNEVNNKIPIYNQNVIYIPRETFGIKHMICNGKLKTYCKTEQKEFYALDLDRGYVKIKLDYCPDCGRYFDMSGSYIKRKFKNIAVLKEKFVEVTIEKKEEPPKVKKDKIKITKKPQVHELNDKDRIEDQKKFIKRHERHIIDNTKVIIDGKTIGCFYCRNCKSYGIPHKLYELYDNKNIDLNNATNNKTNTSVKKEEIREKINFFIKVNTFRCDAKKHKIEQIDAYVDVINMKTKEITNVKINAYYCKNCKLYYIYQNEYDELNKKGIPICPIHEETKYFSIKNGFDTYNETSLLRNLGYTVNQQDDLSSIQRERILETIIEKGIMRKSEVLSFLNYLISSRKNQMNMSKAVSKWKSDVKYVENLSRGDSRAVQVGAFKKIKTI